MGRSRLTLIQQGNGKGTGDGMGRIRRAWGTVKRLPSGNWRASYVGPDGGVYAGPTTYSTQMDAEVWLGQERRLIDSDTWEPPGSRTTRRGRARQTFGEYAADWVGSRQVRGQPLKPRTREHYEGLLERVILPTFAARPLGAISANEVEAWYRGLDPKAPTYRAHAYSLLRTILGSVDPSILNANPAHIRGAGTARRRHRVEPLTLDELATLVEAMPENRRLMVLLGAWCALRFGELAELRRSDLDLRNGVVKVRRGVVRTNQGKQIGTTKSDAGARNVTIPPHLMPSVRDHLRDHTGGGRDALLFPAASGGNLSPSTFYGRAPEAVRGRGQRMVELRGGHGYYRARAIAGRPDAHFHDLRHTGAVLAAQTGATLAELMARLGHSTPAAAMRYQHAAQDRDKAIAVALSKLAGGTDGPG